MNGTKQIRLIDIAEKANVSPTTVGFVLQGSGGKNIRVAEKTADRIRKIAKKFNYAPNIAAQQLAGKKSMTMGILIDPRPLTINSVRLAVIGERAKQLGYHLIILHEYPNLDSISEAIDELAARQVDGVICMHHIYPHLDINIPEMVSRKIRNSVFIDPPAAAETSYVAFDFEDSAMKMVEYLYNKGKRNIAHCTKNLDWHSTASIHKGYIKAVEKFGLPTKKELIWISSDHDSKQDDRSFSPEQAKQAVDSLVREHSADAIVSADDYVGAQIINQLKIQGYRVPQDVAVTGGGNYDICTYTLPQLTSTDQRFEDVAREAVNLLVDLIGNEKHKSKPVVLQAKIIERDSA